MKCSRLCGNIWGNSAVISTSRHSVSECSHFQPEAVISICYLPYLKRWNLVTPLRMSKIIWALQWDKCFDCVKSKFLPFFILKCCGNCAVLQTGTISKTITTNTTSGCSDNNKNTLASFSSALKGSVHWGENEICWVQYYRGMLHALTRCLASPSINCLLFSKKEMFR